MFLTVIIFFQLIILKLIFLNYCYILVFVLFKMLHYVLERKFNLKVFHIMPTDWHS